jgi:hypothetical protein
MLDTEIFTFSMTFTGTVIYLALNELVYCNLDSDILHPYH